MPTSRERLRTRLRRKAAFLVETGSASRRAMSADEAEHFLWERERPEEQLTALGAPSERPRRRRGGTVGRHRRHGHRGGRPSHLRRVAGTRGSRGVPPRGRGPEVGRGDVARRAAPRRPRARVWMRRAHEYDEYDEYGVAGRYPQLLFKRLHAGTPSRRARPSPPRARAAGGARLAENARLAARLPGRAAALRVSRVPCGAPARGAPRVREMRLEGGRQEHGVLLSRDERAAATRRNRQMFHSKNKKSRHPRASRASACRRKRRARAPASEGRRDHRHPRRCVPPASGDPAEPPREAPAGQTRLADAAGSSTPGARTPAPAPAAAKRRARRRHARGPHAPRRRLRPWPAPSSTQAPTWSARTSGSRRWRWRGARAPRGARLLAAGGPRRGRGRRGPRARCARERPRGRPALNPGRARGERFAFDRRSLDGRGDGEGGDARRRRRVFPRQTSSRDPADHDARARASVRDGGGGVRGRGGVRRRVLRRPR